MKPTTDSYALKSVLDLPVPFRSTFSFRYFNSLQSECFSACFHSDINMVISAPTGSGKTVLFELSILRLLSRFLSEERFMHIKGTLKTIYISPSKALIQEKLRDWNQKLGSWGINCLELTGDNEFYDLRNIHDADIILTTPEKFDAVTRFGIKDGALSFFSDIALVLIDEVHLLNDPRGAALEAVVSRIKMLSRNPEMISSPLANVRFIAASATIPNIDDLAVWLMVPAQGMKRFGEEMRPVKLTTKVFGYTPAKNDFLFEKRLQIYIFDILMQYSRGKSTLVFCSTRKGAQEAAQLLSQKVMTYGHSNPFIKSNEQLDRLREASLSCSDKQMQSYLLYGVGYHNGGLCMNDRNLVESLFLKGDIQILCTTNTLAHGVNLPAHTVVIKSTQYYNKEKGMYVEYERSMVLQMCGRAGRPPFDDTGTVIIMTRRETEHLYENILNGCEMVESQLLPCVTEHLTAEIVQLTVSDITRAIEWMKCSYLYVRMKKNPGNYSIKKGITSTQIERYLQEVCVQKVNELSSHQMIWTDEDGFILKPLEPGRLMTKYYLKFNTMKYIMQSPTNCSLEDALHIVSRSEEISWIQLRRNEKKLLNDINNDKAGRLRFHILGDNGKPKKRIQSTEEKIFILANDFLTGDPSIHDLSLTQDMNSICTNGSRVARCMKYYFAYQKNYKGSLNSTLLAKALHKKLWDDSPYLLKQLPGIGTVTAKALHSMGINSFETLADADPRRIEIITGRKYPFGNHIKESLQSLPPKLEIKVEEVTCERQGKAKLAITLTRLSQSVQSTKRHYADMVVGAEEKNLILFYEKIRVEEFSSPYNTTILLSCPSQGKLTIRANLIFEDYIGIDLHQKLILLRENSSHKIHRHRSKQAYSVAPPGELHDIEDGNKTTSQTPAKELRSSNKSKVDISSMPSFNLLDDFLEEEGEPVVEIEEEDCKIITGNTVFDHIREKAKNFHVLDVSNCAYPSQSDARTLPRKRIREKVIDVDSDVEETLTNNIQRQSVHIPCFESQVGDRSQSLTPKHQSTAIDSGTSTICLINDRGKLSPESEESAFKPLTEERLFDHIRKKAKNFLVFDRFKMRDTHDPLISTNEHGFSENQTDICGQAITKNEVRRDSLVFSDSETPERDKDRVYKKMEFSPKCLSKLSKVTSVSPCFSNSLVNSAQLVDNVKVTEGRMNQLYSPFRAKRQCCSIATPEKSKEADSFLGFKSIFSFL